MCERHSEVQNITRQPLSWRYTVLNPRVTLNCLSRKTIEHKNLKLSNERSGPGTSESLRSGAVFDCSAGLSYRDLVKKPWVFIRGFMVYV